eukprot:5454376-Prymnesium_polylepis.1
MARTFDSSCSTGSPFMIDKFSAAAALGNIVVFAPRNADSVGTYDVIMGTFDTPVNTGIYVDTKYMGAVAVGDLVVFAPSSADAVG